jgi:chemotaxis protein CheX
MASKMLGVPIEEVDSDSWDALGEIANMIAGNFKGKLSGVGNHCMLSVPTIIVGTDYETRSLTGGNMIEVVFEFEKKPLWVTLELHE